MTAEVPLLITASWHRLNPFGYLVACGGVFLSLFCYVVDFYRWLIPYRSLETLRMELGLVSRLPGGVSEAVGAMLVG